MSTEKYVPSRKDVAIKKSLLAKTQVLIAEAAKYAKMGDEVWTLTYLRSAISLLEAVRNL